MIKVYTPDSYDKFRCLASACPDTCCQQWDIDIDPDTMALYASLPGPLGEKVRSSLSQGEDGPIFAVNGGDCPMHRSDGLCEIQAALGPQALSQVCRDFPRLHHDYGDFRELGLELSCPEAARILLTEGAGPVTVTELPEDSEADYDAEAMAVLLATRKAALALLEEENLSLSDALTLLFFYGCHAQSLLDGEEPDAFSRENALETAREFGSPGDFTQILTFFGSLDILTEDWKQLLCNASSRPFPPACRNLARYLVGRYWLHAVSDYDLYCRVKFILISCLLVTGLPGDFVRNAQLWSKEIENDCDNLDAILDAAYEDPVFTDNRLLGYVQSFSDF